ncbi:MAG: heavy metal-binding domain-containing protein [Usitatibacteraceae bacterium]
MDNRMVTTTNEMPGQAVIENLGVVRGLGVRSRSISIYTELCEQTRVEAFELMCAQARQRNADAIIGMRYDATEVMPGLTEVLCYGTAVRLARKER